MPGKTHKTTWRAKRDPLWRGDATTLSTPDPKASRSIVRHIMYLDGAGRTTPYHSTSEDRDTASHFADRGRVWETDVVTAEEVGIKHVSRLELLKLLKGTGHGDAAWSSAIEVMQAKRYVEQWGEHLLSYTDISDSAAAASAAAKAFK